jgi:hypothetical protein
MLLLRRATGSELAKSSRAGGKPENSTLQKQLLSMGCRPDP